MHTGRDGGTLPAGLATLAVLRNQRAGNDCRNCRHNDPALPEKSTPRPGICGWAQRAVGCGRWKGHHE